MVLRDSAPGRIAGAVPAPAHGAVTVHAAQGREIDLVLYGPAEARARDRGIGLGFTHDTDSLRRDAADAQGGGVLHIRQAPTFFEPSVGSFAAPTQLRKEMMQ